MKRVGRRLPKSRPLCPLESQEQEAVIQWAQRARLPRKVAERLDRELLAGLVNPLAVDSWLVGSANGLFVGGRTRAARIRMSNMKRQGLKVGFPDLQLVIPCGPYPSLMIEMKRQRGSTVEPHQKQYHQLLRAAGHKVVVARGAGQAIDAIQEYLLQ